MSEANEPEEVTETVENSIEDAPAPLQIALNDQEAAHMDQKICVRSYGAALANAARAGAKGRLLKRMGGDYLLEDFVNGGCAQHDIEALIAVRFGAKLERTGKNTGAGEFIKGHLRDGRSTAEIIAVGSIRFPDVPWSSSYISHYRSKLGMSKPTKKTLAKRAAADAS